MKSSKLVWLCLLCITLQSKANVFITEIADPDDTWQNRFIELHNNGSSSVSLSGWSLRLYFNANTTYSTISLSGNIAAGDFYIISYNSTTAFNTAYGLASHLGTGTYNSNGDDNMELYDGTTLIDVYGHPGTDGTGTCNEFEDGRAERKSTITSGSATFCPQDWNIYADNGNTGTDCGTCSNTNSPKNTIDMDPGGWVGASSSPLLSLSAGVGDLSYLSGSGPSNEAVYSVVGSNLTGSNVTISLGSDFEVSSSSGGSFGSSISIGVSSGSVSSNVYVRLKAGLSGGIYTDSVLTSDGVSAWDTLLIGGSVSKKLLPGDLVIVGYDTYTGTGGPDKLSIMALTSIPTGTQFTLANLVFEWKAAAYERTNRWYNGNGSIANDPAYTTLTYEGTGLTAGDIICIELNPSGASIGAIDLNGTSTSDFSDDNRQYVNAASGSPDVLWLMQGSMPAAQTDGAGDQYLLIPDVNVLGAIHTDEDFRSFDEAGNAGGSRVSRLHPQVECFSLSSGPWAGSNGWYGYYDMSVTSGTQHALLSAITDFSNWTSVTGGYVGDDLPAATCNTSITISGVAAQEGYWVGNATGDANNWFNCRNWDNFTVPDSSVDVEVATSTPNCEIDTAANFSNSFGDTAQCKSLSIDDAVYVQEEGSVLMIWADLIIADDAELDMSTSAGSVGGTLHLKGNWTSNQMTGNDGFAQGNASKVIFDGLQSQTIYDADGPEVFAYLEIKNSNGVVLASEAKVSQDLALSEGVLKINTFDLTLEEDATITGTFSSSEMIEADQSGFVRHQFNAAENYFFPIGDSTGDYTPIELDFTTLTLGANSFFDPGVNVTDQVQPTKPAGNDTYLSRYWTVDGDNGIIPQSSISAFSCDVELHYLQADVIIGTGDTEDSLTASKYDGTWTEQLTSVNISNNILTFTGATSFSDFTGLPVDLVVFSGKRADGINHLIWQTASEYNSSHFELLHADEEGLFTIVGTISTEGNSNEIQLYDFNHSYHGQFSRYKLRHVDANGVESYSDELVLTDQWNTSIINTKSTIGFSNLIAGENIVIYSQYGQKLISESVELTGPILFSKNQFRKGLYYIQRGKESPFLFQVY